MSHVSSHITCLSIFLAGARKRDLGTTSYQEIQVSNATTTITQPPSFPHRPQHHSFPRPVRHRHTHRQHTTSRLFFFWPAVPAAGTLQSFTKLLQLLAVVTVRWYLSSGIDLLVPVHESVEHKHQLKSRNSSPLPLFSYCTHDTYLTLKFRTVLHIPSQHSVITDKSLSLTLIYNCRHSAQSPNFS